MIRSVFRGLWRLLTAPFRLIFRPFQYIYQAINYEPEDAPLGDVFARALESPSLLVEHIEALRRHLLRALAVLALATVISIPFASQILEWLTGPLPGGMDSLQAIEVTESIGAFMRIILLTGFSVSLPYIGFEVLAFLNPGLRRNERIFILTTIPAATFLFITGMAFAFFIMLPVALPFLLGFLGITTVPRPSNYIRFVTGLMFWIGISFQFPLVIYASARIGLVKARTLIRGWRYAILAIAILAAAVTPTVDPVNMALVMAPMIVLYILGIGLASLASGRSDRSVQESD